MASTAKPVRKRAKEIGKDKAISEATSKGHRVDPKASAKRSNRLSGHLKKEVIKNRIGVEKGSIKNEEAKKSVDKKARELHKKLPKSRKKGMTGIRFEHHFDD